MYVYCVLRIITHQPTEPKNAITHNISIILIICFQTRIIVSFVVFDLFLFYCEYYFAWWWFHEWGKEYSMNWCIEIKWSRHPPKKTPAPVFFIRFFREIELLLFIDLKISKGFDCSLFSNLVLSDHLFGDVAINATHAFISHDKKEETRTQMRMWIWQYLIAFA